MKNTLPKPRPIEFMLRGHDLETAIRALDGWEGLTDCELEKLGFIERRASGGAEDSEAEGATVHWLRPFPER